MSYDPEQVASYYIALFAPRADVYSHWVTDPKILKGDEPRWQPAGRWSGPRDARVYARDPLTPQVILDGLTKRGPSVSCYLIAPGGVSHVFAIDLDLDDGHDWAMKIGALMVDAGIHCYVEASRRGAHLWGSVDEQVPAKVLRRMMRFFIEKAGVPRVYDAEAGRWVDDARVELRPGADQLAEGALGHALRMPTMPHPKTGKRYSLVYPWGPSPLEGTSLGENLLHLLTTPRAKIVEIATDYVPLVDPRHLPRDMDRPKPPRGPDEFENASASEILRDLWGVQNARPGIAVKCPAHDDQHPSLSITRDDRRAICHGPGCILNNDGRGRGTFELTKYAPASRTRAS
jgi:hypothetical protein